MAWRLADSWLGPEAPARSVGVNWWVGCFGGLEEWLPERNPPRTDSQFAEGCTWGAGRRDGNGATGPIELCGRPSIASHAGTRVAGGRRLVAGACFAAMHNAVAAVLVRRWRLPGQQRRA